MAAPMRKLWLEKLPSIPAVEKICRSQSVRIEPFASKKNFISTPPNDDWFSERGGGGGSDFLFNEANKIWTLGEYVACQDS